MSEHRLTADEERTLHMIYFPRPDLTPCTATEVRHTLPLVLAEAGGPEDEELLAKVNALSDGELGALVGRWQAAWDRDGGRS